MTTTASPHRNGTPRTVPRRLGAFSWASPAWLSPAPGLYQFERWAMPDGGTRWFPMLAGRYLDADRKPIDDWNAAQNFPTTEAIVAWLRSAGPAQPEAATPPPADWVSFRFRAGGRIFEICRSEQEGGEAWHVQLDGRFLTSDVIGPPPSPAQVEVWDYDGTPAPPAWFPSAHEAQAAVEAYLAKDRQGRVVEMLRTAIAQVDQGQVTATLERGEPRDPSWRVLFRPATPPAPCPERT